jgi:hypothetical protein
MGFLAVVAVMLAGFWCLWCFLEANCPDCPQRGLFCLAGCLKASGRSRVNATAAARKAGADEILDGEPT